MKKLLSWSVLSVLLPSLVGLGFGVLALGDLDDFIIAEACFLIVCLVLGVKIVLWGAERRRTVMSYLLVFIGCGALGVAALAAVHYVNRKREAKINATHATQAQPTVEDVKPPEVKVDKPEPNLIPVGYGKRHIVLDHATQTFKEEDSGILVVVAQFRNAHKRGKELSEANDIRAHIYYEPSEFYKKLDRNIPGFAKVDDGIWLNEKHPLVNFARGETKTLILAVDMGDGGFGTFDYRIETTDGEERLLPRVPKLTADKYVVKVEITGGTHGEIAELYHFTITLRPEFNISFG